MFSGEHCADPCTFGAGNTGLPWFLQWCLMWSSACKTLARLTARGLFREAFWAPSPAAPDRARDGSQIYAATLARNFYRWPCKGLYTIDVMEEMDFQDVLCAMAGEHGPGSVDLEVQAFLVPSADPHDTESVRVDIKGSTVGYLDYDLAPILRMKLLTLGLGDAVTGCAGIIRGGIRSFDGSRTPYWIALDEGLLPIWRESISCDISET